MKQYKIVMAKLAIWHEIKEKYADLFNSPAYVELDREDEIIVVLKLIQVSALSGKLEGYSTISTSVTKNPFCLARMKDPEKICSACYAVKNLDRRDALKQNLDINFEILNKVLISEAAWKFAAIQTCNGDARIESHGDVATVTCARNYIRCAKAHEWITFGVWTKNWNLWKIAFELEGGKPENIVFNVSSDKLNTRMDIPESIENIVDHVFTVFDKKYIKEHNININCGAKNCAGCRICYKKDTEKYVNEKKK